MIISETGIRKIINAKLDEGGFGDRGIELGKVSDEICDLSNLDDTALAIWFSKHFLFNAEGMTKKTLMGSLKNVARMGRTPQEDAQFEAAVRAAIASDPSIVEKYRKALEYGVTFLLGRTVAVSFCAFLNTLIGTKKGTQAPPPVDPKNIGQSFNSAFGASANQFALENQKVRSLIGLGISTENIFVFPRTSILIGAGDNEKVNEKFSEEIVKAKFIIEADNKKPSQIFEKINDYYYGIPGKRVFLRELSKFFDAVDDTYDNGDAIRSAMAVLYNEAQEVFSTKF